MTEDNNESFMEISGNGNKYWKNKQGKYHRLDGPAVERADGSKDWWVDGKRHRTDGPAVERAYGLKRWYVHDKLHRLDGPAIEDANGSKYWWVDGINLTEEEFNYWSKDWNEEKEIMFGLTYS